LQFLFCCQGAGEQLIEKPQRRRGREAEGGGLLNNELLFFQSLTLFRQLL
jgi:hypothetical protein